MHLIVLTAPEMMSEVWMDGGGGGDVWCCQGDATFCLEHDIICTHTAEKVMTQTLGTTTMVLSPSALYFKWSHPYFFHSSPIHPLSPYILLFARCDSDCQKQERLAEYCVCWEEANTFLGKLNSRRYIELSVSVWIGTRRFYQFLCHKHES